MPANIDSMMYVNETPWHREGVALDKPPSVEDALDYAGLNWTVEKRDTFYSLSNNYNAQAPLSQVPNSYVTIRTDNGKCIIRLWLRTRNSRCNTRWEKSMDIG